MTTSAPHSSQSSPDGPLIVVSGPSGVGKSTLLRELSQRRSFGFSVSATTRDPRPSEVDGIHYHFVSRERFDAMIAGGELLEWAEYGGNLYGTPVSSIREAMATEDVVILDIELEGARQVRALFPDAVLVWVTPPSWDELERRLRERDDTDPPAIIRRLDRARRDMDLAPSLFDHIVVNDEVVAATDRIEAIVDGALGR